MTSDPATETITILMPVYGRSELLEQALASVVAQSCPDWRLLIADDGSDPLTRQWLERWIAHHQRHHEVSWLKRPVNLGLFANLNDAIHASGASWLLLLCTDDLLLPSAVATLRDLRMAYPEASLILSTFLSIGTAGEWRAPSSALYHDQLSPVTTLLPSERVLPSLLELGSLNGNLTGMAFRVALWRRVGPFRPDWRHAADWEWLARAAAAAPLLLNRTPIAKVRTHAGQLSDANRRSGHELPEVASVVADLRRHPLLASEPRRHGWAAHLMQFQLWNIGKRLLRGDRRHLRRDLAAIHRAAGLGRTFLQLLAWLPERWRHHRAG